MRSNHRMVPKLRFAEFSGQWVKKRLGEVAKIVMGQSPKSQFYNTNKKGLPLIQGADDFTKIHKYTTQITKICEQNDIIMSVRAPVGTLAKAKERCCLGRGVCAIKANDFFYYLLDKERNRLQKYAQGSTFDAIGSKDLQSFQILIPPTLAEQEKIASFLSAIDVKISLQEQKIEQLEKYKKALLQKLFPTKDTKVPELRFPEFSGEWVEKRLGEIFIVKRGASPRPIQKFLSKVGINWIKIGDVESNSKYVVQTKEKIIIDGANKSIRVYPNDFILSNSMSFGRPYISKIEGCIHDGWLLLRKKLKSIDIEYFYYNLLISNIQKKFKSTAAGSTVNNLKVDSVKRVKILLSPTLAEQQKIASFFSSIDEKIELEKEKLEKIKEYKKGLLQKMFV